MNYGIPISEISSASIQTRLQRWQSVGLLKIGDSEDEDQLIAEGEALIALTHSRTPVRRS